MSTSSTRDGEVSADHWGAPAARAEVFTAEQLGNRARAQGLHFPPSVLGPLIAALRADKHVVLIGPPGTGKSSLATAVADLGREAMLCSGCLATTATSNWSVIDTVGGTFESAGGFTFRQGVVLEAIQTGRWLLIDELNRANLDRALGEFFSVLSGQAVVLPFKSSDFGHHVSLVPFGAEVPPHTEPIRIPRAWRIIATMNEYDRGLLFHMSHALMRRFAFIRVSSPDEDVFRSLLDGPAEVVKSLLPLRQIKDMGPAIYLDAADYAIERQRDGVSDSRILVEVLNAFFLPQFDGLDTHRGRHLMSILSSSLEPADLAEIGDVLREMGSFLDGEDNA